MQLLDLQLYPGSSNWHLRNIRYYVHSDYGIKSCMLFEADSTSASSLETDSGTSDMHLCRNGLGQLPCLSLPLCNISLLICSQLHVSTFSNIVGNHSFLTLHVNVLFVTLKIERKSSGECIVLGTDD